MTIEARREYLAVMRQRYIDATKSQKGRLLDELCAVCGYNRKHAIRVLGGERPERRGRPGPRPRYGEDVVAHLARLWRLMNYMCAVRMKAALPIWLAYYAPEDLTAETRQKLLAISSSSINRLLKPHRDGSPRGLSSTKAGAFLKSQIPIELIDKHVDRPGYIEADTVAHCGNSLAGDFANTLTLTDLQSGWTANRATWTKEANEVLAKIIEIRGELPFRMVGFACDNGSEFINRSLVSYLQDRKKGFVRFVRRRPYKKNDAAHVEQKNDTHVRQLFGYQRIDDSELVPLMNDIYSRYWNPLQNHFCPVMKLIRKTRVGGKLRKVYDQPKTPYERLLASGKLTELQSERLIADHAQLNPIDLKAGLDSKLQIFGTRLHRQAQGPKGDNEAA